MSVKVTSLKEKARASRNGNQSESTHTRLVDTVFSPDVDQLEGLTRTPLDKVSPLAFLRMYAREIIRLCKMSVESQKLYTENYKIWHSNNINIEGLGKRIMPIDKPIDIKRWKQDIRAGKEFDYKKYRTDNSEGKIYTAEELVGINKSLVDVKKDFRFKIPKEAEMASIIFQFHYDMRRRSTIPDVLLEAFGVMARAIEVGQGENDNMPTKVYKNQ